LFARKHPESIDDDATYPPDVINDDATYPPDVIDDDATYPPDVADHSLLLRQDPLPANLSNHGFVVLWDCATLPLLFNPVSIMSFGFENQTMGSGQRSNEEANLLRHWGWKIDWKLSVMSDHSEQLLARLIFHKAQHNFPFYNTLLTSFRISRAASQNHEALLLRRHSLPPRWRCRLCSFDETNLQDSGNDILGCVHEWLDA